MSALRKPEPEQLPLPLERSFRDWFYDNNEMVALGAVVLIIVLVAAAILLLIPLARADDGHRWEHFTSATGEVFAVDLGMYTRMWTPGVAVALLCSPVVRGRCSPLDARRAFFRCGDEYATVEASANEQADGVYVRPTTVYVPPLSVLGEARDAVCAKVGRAARP